MSPKNDGLAFRFDRMTMLLAHAGRALLPGRGVAAEPDQTATNTVHFLADAPAACSASRRVISLRHGDQSCTRFRVPDWDHPPEIIEWRGRRFVRQGQGRYREASMLTLYVGYNAECLDQERSTRGSPAP